ncbi:MAG: DUF2666 domain-containing protein [Candidatus Methanofastidiosa archaeon]|nr:DUF2666 domain-containing protein [Candidatus Methanofastidiosa archaeon]
MDNHVHFSAKHGSWIAVKKLTIDDVTTDLDIARTLISIRETLDAKIYQYLSKDFDIAALEAKIGEFVPSGRLNEEAMASALKEAKSPKMTKFLKTLTDDKNKLEVYKGLAVELTLARLKLSGMDRKPLDKYIDAMHRRLQ